MSFNVSYLEACLVLGGMSFNVLSEFFKFSDSNVFYWIFNFVSFPSNNPATFLYYGIIRCSHVFTSHFIIPSCGRGHMIKFWCINFLLINVKLVTICISSSRHYRVQCLSEYDCLQFLYDINTALETTNGHFVFSMPNDSFAPNRCDVMAQWWDQELTLTVGTL